MGTRLSRRFRPVNMNGCSLYLPFWAYNGGQTSLADYSGNNNTATVNGTVIKSSSPTQGWWFSGTDDYLSIADSTSMRGSGGDVTILAWIWNNATASALKMIHAWRETNFQSYLTIWTDETVRFSLRIGTSQTAKGSTSLVTVQKWTLIGGVRNGTSVGTIYNGAIENAESGYVGITNLGTSGSYVGAWNDLTRDFTGSIDKVLILDRALSAAEIKSFYELTRFRYGV